MARKLLASGLSIVVAALLAGAASAIDVVKPLAIGEKIESFKLIDFRGKTWSLDDFKDQKVVVVAFLGVECPLARQYGGRVQEIASKYPKDVAVLGVFSNQQDSLAEIGHYARDLKVEIPLLKDGGNAIADQFRAARTPEAFVLDAERRIRYHGRIDDQFTYGRQRPKVEHEYVIEAIDAVLAGKPPAIGETELVGCHIGRVLKAKPNSDVTYSKQISRLLNQHCANCHRPGEIGPFSLTNYAEAVGWAAMIREVVKEERMPPWHANPAHGKFANDARLSDEEKDLIYRWVDAGAPEGNRKDLPEPPKFAEGWQAGKPEMVVFMHDKPFTVPASGEIKYQHFVVDPGFTEDKWVKAAECRPGNRSVVHHMIVAVLPPAGSRQLADVPSEFLTAAAAGSRPMVMPEGMAKLVPAGSKLAFQLHYTPVGTAQDDRSSVGLHFVDAKQVRRQVGTDKASNPGLRIPAGAENHRIEANHMFHRDMVLLSLFPHMHLRGKAFRYTAVYPTGDEEVLLDVPRYDFNWQNSYVYPEPKRMPAGTKLHCEAWFDNSDQNLANPDPTKEVRWGDQTWEEMMIGYFDAAPADERARGGKTRTSVFVELAKQNPPKLSEDVQALARTALKSDGHFRRFGPKLREVIPQIDRICLTLVEGDALHVRRCIQEPERDQQVGGAGRKLDKRMSVITSYAERSEPIVHQKLAGESAMDLKFMSNAFGASAHFPVKLDGVSGTVNFWSSEAEAFPEEALVVLKEVAALMMEPMK